MTQTADASPSLADPFDAGPFVRLRMPHDALPTTTSNVVRRALTVAVVGWVPLAVLAAAQGYALRDAPRESLLLDPYAYARYLVAAPLFVLAEAACIPRLALIARHFGDAGLISNADRQRYHELIAAARKSLDPRHAGVVIVLVAYAVTLALGWSIDATGYSGRTSTWASPVVEGVGSVSLAGIWRWLVSQPLLLTLFGAWLWRLIVWTRFLRGVARLDLLIIPSHPDLAGGLRFVSTSLPPFALVGLALGAWVAGGAANSVLYDERSLRDVVTAAVVVALLILLLCAGPLLALASPMRRARIRGAFEYGKLAEALGRRFEERWLERKTVVDADALGAPDFSATTDLFSVAANVRMMRALPLDLTTVATLVAATALPFVPVLLLMLPLDQLLRYAAKLLL